MAEIKIAAENLSCCLCGLYEEGGGSVATCPDRHTLCTNCLRAYTRAHEKLSKSNQKAPAEMICAMSGCVKALEARERQVGGKDAPASAIRVSRLKPTDVEYETIASKFGKSVEAKWIQELCRLDNPPLRAIFEACKARMEKEGRSGGVGANEALLFHATARAACGAIMREGFDMRRNGSAHGQAYGPGAYFAATAAISHGYSRIDGRNQRCMLLCRVLLGDTSGRDSVAAPSEVFVVNREQQILPTYMIIYADPDDRYTMRLIPSPKMGGQPPPKPRAKKAARAKPAAAKPAAAKPA